MNDAFLNENEKYIVLRLLNEVMGTDGLENDEMNLLRKLEKTCIDYYMDLSEIVVMFKNWLELKEESLEKELALRYSEPDTFEMGVLTGSLSAYSEIANYLEYLEGLTVERDCADEFPEGEC